MMRLLLFVAALVFVPGLLDGLLGSADLGIMFALVIGGGILPPVGSADLAQLNATTRRAFIAKCVVAIGSATPALAAGLSNAQPASGGVSSLTLPVQGAPMVTPQYTDWTGSFNQPSGATGISEADWNLKCLVVPIQFNALEGIAQQSAAVVPILEVRMNDAGNQAAGLLSNDFWNNGAQGLNIDGLPMIMATANTYGNIDRSQAANAFWRALVRAQGAVAPTRLRVLTDIILCANNAGGEMPNIACTSPRTWLALAADFVGAENYRVTPGTGFDMDTMGVRGAFSAISVGGVPIYVDPGCPDGTVAYWNTRYQSMYLHESAAFVFTGFASTLPTLSLGYVGALVAVLENVNVNPRSTTLSTGYSFQS